MALYATQMSKWTPWTTLSSSSPHKPVVKIFCESSGKHTDQIITKQIKAFLPLQNKNDVWIYTPQKLKETENLEKATNTDGYVGIIFLGVIQE